MTLRDYPKAEKDFLGCREAYEKIAALQFTNTEELERRRAQEIEQLQNQLSLISTGQIKISNPSLTQQMQQRIDDLRRNQRKGGNEAMNIPAELFVSLGSAYFYQGKVADAEKEWKTAASINPKLGEAHNNLAALYLHGERAGRGGEGAEARGEGGLPGEPAVQGRHQEGPQVGPFQLRARA